MENSNGDIIIYQTEDGLTKIDVKLENETVWLSQQQMAELYDTTKQNISLHIKNIFDENELDENSTVKEFLTVQKEGNRNVERNVKFYNDEEWVDFPNEYHMGAERYYNYFYEEELNKIITKIGYQILDFHKESGENNNKWLVYVLKK